jgi:hypothetical protein
VEDVSTGTPNRWQSGKHKVAYVLIGALVLGLILTIFFPSFRPKNVLESNKNHFTQYIIKSPPSPPVVLAVPGQSSATKASKSTSGEAEKSHGAGSAPVPTHPKPISEHHRSTRNHGSKPKPGLGNSSHPTPTATTSNKTEEVVSP